MSTNTGATEPTSDALVSSEPPSNSDVAVSNGVTVVVEAEPLDSKTETLVDDDSRISGGEIGDVMGKDEKVGGDVVVQGSIDDSMVSVDGIEIVMNNSEVGLDKLISDAVVSSELLSDREVDAVNKVKIGDDSLGSESMKPMTNCNGDCDIVVQDSVDDCRASRDEEGVVIEDIEKVYDENEVKNNEKEGECKVTDGDTVVHDSVDDSKASRDEKGIVMENVEKVFDENEVNDEEKEGEYKVTDGDIVIHDSVDDSKASMDEKGIVMENTEKVFDENEVNDEEKEGDYKVTDGDIVVHDSVDDSKVSRDEKGIVMENIEKVFDENKVNDEEKEGEYKVTDIVWAKVKDYPWWPGQIFDPSSATDKAKKFFNKKGLLIGYFGDHSFAWNKPPNIKPFRKNFTKLAKQSNSKAFHHAVNCALDEVSRRVEFGLACSCLSKEVYDKLKTQVFVNAGIREEDSKIDGGDRFSTVSIFKPVKVVQSVQELAREPFDVFSRLEVLSVRSQLLAFFRWKGYYQLQAQSIVDGLDNKLETESELPLTEDIEVVENEKLVSLGKKVPSKKRKPDVCDSDDDSVLRKKERSLTNVTPKGNSSAKRSKKDSSKKATVEDNVITEENGNEKTDSADKKVSSKKRKSDVCDGDDSVPRKKERSLTSVTPEGNSSAKRSKKDISKKTTVEDNVIKEENGNEKRDSVSKKVYSKRRKPDVCHNDDSDDSVPRKKESSLTKKTSKGSSSVKKSKNNISKKATLKDNVKGENGNGSNDKKSSISSPKKLFRIGESICKIAKQISESPSVLKKESGKSKNDGNSATLRKTAKKDGQPVEAIQTEE